MQAGTYTNDFASINKNITLHGVGGMVNLVASGNISNGKGIFVVNGNVNIDHFSFSGAKVADGNGAGIRFESGNLVLDNDYFFNNQDGLLPVPAARSRSATASSPTTAPATVIRITST